MPWTRLDPAKVAPLLRAAWDPTSPGDDALAEQALAHLREALLSGHYVVVQDGLGRTFIGTRTLNQGVIASSGCHAFHAFNHVSLTYAVRE